MLERESHGRKLREVWSSPTRSTVDTAIFLIKMSRQWKLCLASPHEWSAPSVQQQRVAQGCVISCVKSGLKISSECLFWTWSLPKPSEKLAPMTWRSTDQLPQASNTASVLWQSHCHLVVTSCYQKLSTIPKVVCQMQQCCAVPHGRKLCAICYCKLLSKHQIHFTPILQCCLVQSK